MNPLTKLWRLAVNQCTGTSTGLAFGLAANINAEAITTTGSKTMDSADHWIKLSPYVDGDYWELEGKTWKKFRQVVTKEHGDRLVAAFNSLSQKHGEHFRGLPIYAGHPDADPVRWPDERRLGGVMGVEAREDGIYVKCAWNDLGEKNRTEGYLVYPSPAWPYDMQLKNRTGRIEPIELRSIGMTNTPRIAGVPAWTNSDPSPSPTNPYEIMLKTLLCKILGIAETSTDEEITKAGEAFIAKAGEQKSAADNASVALEAEKKKAMAANSAAEKFRTLAINAATSSAITARKITAAEVPAWAAKLATNFDDAAAELNGKAAVLPNEDLKFKERTGDLSTPLGRKLAFNALLDPQLAKGLGIDAAMDAVRATPEGAALIKAMEDASKTTA